MKNKAEVPLQQNQISKNNKALFIKNLVEFKDKLASKHWLLLVLPMLYILVFLIYPLIYLFMLSLQDKGVITLAFYIRFFTGGIYLRVLLLTFKIGLTVTILCLLLGYPVAYVMTMCSKKARSLILVAIMVPFWTSLLVRTYAWMVLLQSQGVVNSILMNLGIIHEPLKLIYNTTGVLIGMTHVLLPYMILSLYSVMQGIDLNLISAARNLGATKTRAFYEIFVPLTVRGIASGCILVFVMAIGYFVTPSLLGGQKDSMISQLIQVQVNDLLNWGFASAIAFTLLAFTMLLMLISKKYFKVDRLM